MLKPEMRKDGLLMSCLCDAAQSRCADEGYRWKAELETEYAPKSSRFLGSCSFCRSHATSGHDGIYRPCRALAQHIFVLLNDK